MPSYPFKNQVKIVIATMALHNYIRMHARQEMDFEIFDETEGDENDTTEDQDEDCQTSSSSMDKLRDEIAASLVETINL